MPHFRYRAVDADGEAVEGRMTEESAYRVTSILKEQGLQVSAVEEIERSAPLRSSGRRLSWEDLDLLNHQLLAVTRSGLPLAPALEALAKDIRKRPLRAAIEEVRRELELGNSLEEALERHRKRFPPIYVSMIRAGERSGNLSGVLELLTRYTTHTINVRSKLHVAVAYPLFVFAIATIVLYFVMSYVVPVFEEIYFSFGRALPGPTRFWMTVGRAVRDNTTGLFMVVACSVAGLVILVKLLRRTEGGCALLDWLKMQIPVIGKVYYTGSLARFSRALGLLFASEAPAVEALELAAASAGNAPLARAVHGAAERVAAGASIAEALRETAFFTETFCWLLRTGEERNEAGQALLELADAYDRELAAQHLQITWLLGPVLVVILGIIIGAIVFSMYLPLFSLGDAIA